MTTQASGSIRFHLNEDDLVAANQAHLRAQLLHPDRPWTTWVTLALVVVVLLLSGWVALLGDSSTLIMTLVGLSVLTLAAAVIYRWIVPRTARRNFREIAALSLEMEFSWDADGFRLLSEREKARVLWTEISAARKTDEALLLYRSPRQHHIIPLRALAEGEADVVATAAENTGAPRGAG